MSGGGVGKQAGRPFGFREATRDSALRALRGVVRSAASGPERWRPITNPFPDQPRSAMSNLTRYTTGPGFSGLRRDIDRLFDGAMQGADGEQSNVVWAPRTDISETGDRYVVRIDMPGMSKDAIDIQLHEGTLTVSGERKSEHEEKKENVHRVERTYGRFFRSFSLPQASDAERVEAQLEDGVLTIQVPKPEEVKPRKIEVS